LLYLQAGGGPDTVVARHSQTQVYRTLSGIQQNTPYLLVLDADKILPLLRGAGRAEHFTLSRCEDAGPLTFQCGPHFVQISRTTLDGIAQPPPQSVLMGAMVRASVRLPSSTLKRFAGLLELCGSGATVSVIKQSERVYLVLTSSALNYFEPLVEGSVRFSGARHRLKIPRDGLKVLPFLDGDPEVKVKYSARGEDGRLSFELSAGPLTEYGFQTMNEHSIRIDPTEQSNFEYAHGGWLDLSDLKDKLEVFSQGAGVTRLEFLGDRVRFSRGSGHYRSWSDTLASRPTLEVGDGITPLDFNLDAILLEKALKYTPHTGEVAVHRDGGLLLKFEGGSVLKLIT